MTIPRREVLQHKLKIEPEKTKTLSTGTTTLKVVALNGTEQYKTINFVIADLDCADLATGVLVVYAASAADGSGTLKELYRIAYPIGNNQTCVIEVDMSFVMGVSELASGGIVPLSVVLKAEGGDTGDTLALCTISETMYQRDGLTPSSI